jgi:hypothetical protein
MVGMTQLDHTPDREVGAAMSSRREHFMQETLLTGKVPVEEMKTCYQECLENDSNGGHPGGEEAMSPAELHKMKLHHDMESICVQALYQGIIRMFCTKIVTEENGVNGWVLGSTTHSQHRHNTHNTHTTPLLSDWSAFRKALNLPGRILEARFQSLVKVWKDDEVTPNAITLNSSDCANPGKFDQPPVIGNKFAPKPGAILVKVVPCFQTILDVLYGYMTQHLELGRSATHCGQPLI